jgi:HD-GYP domain-containing protein (c-di-GMP phosphodiesterase class II)/GGDEF domain-containing protein
MSPERKLELLVLTVLVVALVVAIIAWIRARDRIAELEADGGDHRASRKVRREMSRIGHDRGALHDPSDTKELVLRTAMSMLEADRGLLLGRHDGDGDGNLDVLCALGFEGDPESDPFVQAIGGRTLKRDETVREANAVAMPVYIAEEFDGAMVCAKDDGDFADYEDEVLLALGDHAGAVLDNSRMRGDLRSAYLGTVRSLADAIEAKDPGVRTHSEEVARYASAVAAKLELEPRRREELLFGSLLHDVGKIGISERILLKPGRLTDDEFNVIKLHPRIGHRIVAGIPALAGIAPAILHHHERYDGSGYPAGLEGERIPLEARIVGVADSFRAMIADRSYSAGRSTEEACAELERCAGTQFDPEVVRLFVEEVRGQPPRPLAGPDPVLDGELAVHRASDGGPLGKPAYALVDSLTLLHSVPYLYELATAEARRAAVQDDGFGLVVVELSGLDGVNRRDGFAAGDRMLIECAAVLRTLEPETGGVGCRLNGCQLALLVRQGVAAARERVREAVGADCQVAAVAWEPGETGYELVCRAQRTVKENRATPTTGRA